MNIQSILVIALCIAAAFTVGAVRNGHNRRRVWVVLLWTVFPIGIIAAAINDRYVDSGPPPAHNPPLEVPTNGYVGSQACSSCHPHEHDTWHSSWHRTMTQVAHPDTVMPDINHVSMDYSGMHFEMDRVGDELWASWGPLNSNPLSDQSLSTRAPIVLTTGSHHMQVYWMSLSDRDRRMALFPFAYLAELDKWVPRDSLFLDPPREDVSFELDTWPLSCIRCHTTSGRFGAGPYGLPDKSTARTQAVEFGIACEACHGPGENHVLVNRNPLHRYRHYLGGAADETIVNPYELDHKRSSQVCGQCHSVQHDYREAAIRVLRDGFEYRPGDDLSNSTIRRVVRCCSDPLIELRARTDPNLSSVTEWFERYYWSDGMIRVSGREFNGLLESPCYEHGDMSCLTCHVMHQPVDDPRPRKQWANDQLKVNMVTGNTACVQCHKSFLDEAALTAHTHHDVDSSGSNCYNCHMSYTTYGLVKAIRSHQIDSPNVSTSLLTGRPNACNQCHLDRTLAWSAGHLADWYDLVPPEMSKDEQSIAASVLWLLRGDAGQRALMAWSYGWTDAQKASGTAWMAPYLAQLLIDPYDAVRLIAHRSLKTIDQYDSIPYDYVGAEEDRETARATVLERWRQRDAAPGPSAAAVLINVDGEIMENVFAPLLQQRDDREIGLRE